MWFITFVYDMVCDWMIFVIYLWLRLFPKEITKPYGHLITHKSIPQYSLNKIFMYFKKVFCRVSIKHPAIYKDNYLNVFHEFFFTIFFADCRPFPIKLDHLAKSALSSKIHAIILPVMWLLNPSGFKMS